MERIGIPEAPIILHGYDYAIPDGRGWGGGMGPLPGRPGWTPSLTRKGYDRKHDKLLRRTIVRELTDAFNAMLQKVADRNPQTHFVDLRDTLPGNDWANELHPTADGFLRVTRKIEAKIRQVVQAQ
jgi:hypothetical protein